MSVAYDAVPVHDDHVIATYLVRATKDTIARRARAISAEESTGSWLHLPAETLQLREQFGASIRRVHHVSDQSFLVQLAFPKVDFEANMPLLLTYLFGGIAALDDIRLVEMSEPSGFRGPRFGISGLRALCGRASGPLLMGIIKPCIGLTPQQHATIASAIAAGGADIVKDDELLVDPPVAPLKARCRAVRQELRSHRRTKRTLYFASVTAPDAARLARDAKECGADGVMVSGFATGLGVIEEIAASAHLPVALHPAMAGALYQAPHGGIDERVVFGRLPRLAGADIAIFFGPFGKYRLASKAVRKITTSLRRPSHLRATFPAIAAGVHPGQVHRLVELCGDDIIIAAGASIVAHPEGPTAGALAFRQAINAAVEGVPLRIACQRHHELRVAIETWSDEHGNDPSYEVIG
jgi:2,3-diketo-5-methylthiopentyl-1-phosphate enolase